MELCYCPGLHSSRAPTLDLIFQVGSTLFCYCWGCSLCASPPLLEKKTCMISYMKDICNWTAGPMQYIYNSKQHMWKPPSTFSPRFFLRKCIWTYQKYKIRKQTRHGLPFLLRALYCMWVRFVGVWLRELSRSFKRNTAYWGIFCNRCLLWHPQ